MPTKAISYTTKRPTDAPTFDEATHTSWVKYGRPFPDNHVLGEEEIKANPELKAIPGYEGEGRWDCYKSRDELIKFVRSNPEYDLVSQLDNGEFVYGLAVVNRLSYFLGMRPSNFSKRKP